ncbi:MAG TPA: hypothetical protein VFE41_17325 [Acetobacteraceae bacterium]|jgi:hypothetical protein|nr:hypothetical protein [Acetobacteraceae bacterium]
MTKTKATLYASTVAFALMGFLPARPASAQVACSAPADHVGTDAIGGVVTSTKGPEGGVLVIAETYDLAPKYVNIVVTDDHRKRLSNEERPDAIPHGYDEIPDISHWVA